MFPEITDPRWERPERYNALQRFALRLIRDERDLVFVRVAALMSLTLVPVGLALLLIPGLFRWWMLPFHLAVVIPVFMDRYVLMLHATSHRTLFKREYDWLNKWIPWGIGPFFGQTPTAFFAHHMGMHHPENNLLGDLSTTLPYQRDKLTHFLHYWGRFLVAGPWHLGMYFHRRGRKKLLVRFLAGELAYLAVLAFFLWWNAPGAVAVLVIPLLFARFAVMAGNWSQHAFVDVDDPNNPYRNSITLINCRHNRRCYNDGYHVVHHVKANLHFTEHPAHFEENLSRYAEDRAIVFEDVFSYQKIWVLLMTHNYERLAEHFVQIGDTPMTRDEIVALLKERTRRTRGEIQPVFRLDPFPPPDVSSPLAAK